MLTVIIFCSFLTMRNVYKVFFPAKEICIYIYIYLHAPKGSQANYIKVWINSPNLSPVKNSQKPKHQIPCYSSLSNTILFLLFQMEKIDSQKRYSLPIRNVPTTSIPKITIKLRDTFSRSIELPN